MPTHPPPNAISISLLHHKKRGLNIFFLPTMLHPFLCPPVQRPPLHRARAGLRRPPRLQPGVAAHRQPEEQEVTASGAELNFPHMFLTPTCLTSPSSSNSSDDFSGAAGAASASIHSSQTTIFNSEQQQQQQQQQQQHQSMSAMPMTSLSDLNFCVGQPAAIQPTALPTVEVIFWLKKSHFWLSTVNLATWYKNQLLMPKPFQ